MKLGLKWTQKRQLSVPGLGKRLTTRARVTSPSAVTVFSSPLTSTCTVERRPLK